MKTIIPFLLAISFWITSLSPVSAAHFSVTDALLIKTNITNAKRDLIEQVLQFDNGVLQIEQLVARIKQAEDLLHRLGKPDSIKDLPGFGREVNSFLREIERSLSSFEIIRDIDPNEIFEDHANSPYAPIKKEIIIDGKKAGEVNPQPLVPELAARRTIRHYQDVRSSTLKKRFQLKGELELAMNMVRNASTTAEVDKLNAVINGLRTQLAVNDSDIQFAANEVATRHYENLNEERIRKKIQIQKDRTDLNKGMTEHLNFFVLPSKPALFKPRH